MKKIMKGFISGVIISTLLMGTVLGEGVKETIEVFVDYVNLTVNGKKIDSNTILYNETTYVPIRSVAEMLGKDVGWNQETQTASINDRAEIIPLSQEDLDYFNGDSFFNGDYLNITNQFLSSSYSKPADIDLFQLFYCGNGTDETMTEDELRQVMGKYNMTGTIEELPCPCEKNSYSNMNKILRKYMGISLADTNKIGLDKFAYLPEYDAYYHFHGDTNYRRKINFSSGERKGNLVRLFYNDGFFADGDKVLTLKEEKGQYLFVSNEKADIY